MKKQVLLITFLAMEGLSAFGQNVSFGVIGGVPFTEQTSNADESRRYIVGPSVEVRLPAGFAIEADALYQRIGNTSFFSVLPASIGSGVSLGTPGVTSFVNRVRGNSWEFPVLGKYYFRPHTAAWQPYAASGWAFRTIGFHDAVSETYIDEKGVSHPLNYRSQFRTGPDVGAVFAAGIRFHRGRLAVLPEVRYTRWGGSDNLTRKNEAGFLLGVRF